MKKNYAVLNSDLPSETMTRRAGFESSPDPVDVSISVTMPVAVYTALAV